MSKEKSVRKTIADDAPKSLDAIFPGDFLTFFISASRIGNGHFVDAPIPFCDFGGNFRLESEAIGPELDALEDLAAENFVARLHIGEFQVGENVRKQREEFVGDIMPEIVDALRTAEKAGAKDYISTAIEDGFEKFVVIARIVFEVSILDEDDVAGNFRKAAAQGRTLSLILRLEKDAEVAEVDGISAVESGCRSFAGVLQLDHFFKDLAGAVGRAVVHENNLFARFGVDDAAEDFFEGGLFIVNGNDDGEFGIDKSEGIVANVGHRIGE